MFGRRFQIRRTHLAAAGLALLVLSGCETYTPAQAVAQNEVTWINLTHDIDFAGPETGLSLLEMARLDDFLAQIDAQATDAIIIDPGVVNSPLTTARIGAVAAHLRQRVPTSQPQARRVGLGDTGGLRLIVGRYLVTPPNCPNWGKPSFRDPMNTTGSNFGCANQVNIGLMVADPGDLVRGRRLTPGMGAAAALGITRYRAGEVIEPVVNTTTESN
ncbi:MAG: CpaD family pilus assembly lipoprotein [Alphaproteobacteria bacterium]